jgi:hypothetical protein
MTATYGNSKCPEFRRKTECYWNLNVVEGVEIVHFSVLTCSKLPHGESDKNWNFFSAIPPSSGHSDKEGGEYVLLIFDIGNRMNLLCNVFCDSEPPTRAVHITQYPFLTRMNTLPSIELPPHSMQRYEINDTKEKRSTKDTKNCVCDVLFF